MAHWHCDVNMPILLFGGEMGASAPWCHCATYALQLTRAYGGGVGGGDEGGPVAGRSSPCGTGDGLLAPRRGGP
eukprot:10223074-Alexandrium_andersonii.AAC.1